MGFVILCVVVLGLKKFLDVLHRRQMNQVPAPVDGMYRLDHTAVARWTVWTAVVTFLAFGIWLVGSAIVGGQLFTLAGILVVVLAASALKVASWARRWSQRRFELSDAGITRYDNGIVTVMRWEDVALLDRDHRWGRHGWLLRGRSGESLILDEDLVGESVLKEHFVRHVPHERWGWGLRLDSDLPRYRVPPHRS
jgi:hypothetical protein